MIGFLFTSAKATKRKTILGKRGQIYLFLE